MSIIKAMLSKKYRVVIYISEFLPDSQTFILSYVNNLKTFCDVCIICSKHSEMVELSEIVEIPFAKVKKWKSLRSFRNQFYDRSYSEKLNQAINRFNPDVIHCHFGDNLPLLVYNLDKKKVAKVICHYWGFDASSVFRNVYHRKLVNKIYREFAIHSFFVSEALKKSFITHVTALSSLLHVVNHGINTQVFVRKNRTKREKTIFLQVSRLVEKKGLRYSIKAFDNMISRLQRKDIEFHIFGTGPLHYRLVSLIANCKNSEQIFLMGKVEHSNIVSVYESASYFLHHSVTAKNGDMEGLPTSIMEAMAMELPIIASNHSGIEELVENGVNGYITREKDINAYSKALERILDWEYKKDNAIKVKNYFNVNKYPKQLLTFITEKSLIS